MLEKNLNSTNSSKEENWCNENNDFPNTRVGVSKSVSPISIRPSWVNVVEKSLRVDHIEQTGEIVGAGLDPIEERVTKDISAMGFERHNTHLEEGGSKVEARELLGSDAVVGIEIIGDEAQALEELVSLAEKDLLRNEDNCENL
ncbi:hypothetical protein V6N12_048048 [Hibiscus sabdariffa]|uniref:Uncharacterized protein n=1 Tax=Hibiscus sabdariffa TaxID=183260 RepID=A0ABR2CWG7_9ROSI